jgi:hypothetical protein
LTTPNHTKPHHTIPYHVFPRNWLDVKPVTEIPLKRISLEKALWALLGIEPLAKRLKTQHNTELLLLTNTAQTKDY